MLRLSATNVSLAGGVLGIRIVSSKCKVKGNYKGYIYCRELIEAIKIKEQFNTILINEKLNLKASFKPLYFNSLVFIFWNLAINIIPGATK